ncbi:MAG: O-methyltransferase [Flavobacteriaceae bacterium]|jgi:predicted O-methyltransferase YrrM|nr:MAG: O-methyltransferase [Flavobacteriaceae bacterium]
MHFLAEALEAYIETHSESEPDLLQELARETHLKVLMPRMITGHYQGRVLSLISRLVRPENILEIGTYTGYSALCLAEGLQAGGRLHTIDKNDELTGMQRRYFDRSPYGKQILQHTGMALDVLPTLKSEFDLVFIDADKSEYPQYYEKVLPMVRPGGLILFDNVLWSGKVLGPVDPKDTAARILSEFNNALMEDKRVRTVMLPIRDGLTICSVE